MNFTQLSVFRKVIETGSISQAAKALGRTQPAISLTIKNLEQSLDLKLFERRGRQLVPVPEALYLLAEASEVLDRLNSVSNTMKSLRKTQAGSVHVAAMPGPAAFVFPRFISQVMAGKDDVRITFSSSSTGQIRELASTQSIDFGFADFEQPARQVPQYKAEIISADCFCAIHKDHPLAGKEKLCVSDLDNERFGTLHADHPLLRRLTEGFRHAGSRLNAVISSQFFLPLIPFISSGHCCSIVDPLTVITERELDIGKGQIRFLPFDTDIRYEYAILTPLHRPPSQLAKRVKEQWSGELMAMLERQNARPRRL